MKKTFRLNSAIRDNDHFATPPAIVSQMQSFLKEQLPVGSTILDPCCGPTGVLTAGLEGYNVTSRDISINPVDDFLALNGLFTGQEKEHYDGIIMNPPYALSKEFLEKALTVADVIVTIQPNMALHSKKLGHLAKHVISETYDPTFTEQFKIQTSKLSIFIMSKKHDNGMTYEDLRRSYYKKNGGLMGLNYYNNSILATPK